MTSASYSEASIDKSQAFRSRLQAKVFLADL
jgi:hypothetical protein